jgi:hypothetical protein
MPILKQSEIPMALRQRQPILLYRRDNLFFLPSQRDTAADEFLESFL